MCVYVCLCVHTYTHLYNIGAAGAANNGEHVGARQHRVRHTTSPIATGALQILKSTLCSVFICEMY